MTILERTYIIPLRKEVQKVPTYKKSKKAMKAIKEFVVRHMKAADFNAVKVLNEANEEIWMHGIRNPPSKIKVVCRRDDKGIVQVQLFGQAFPEAKKAEEKKGLAAKVADKLTGSKPAAAKPAAKPAAPAAKPAPAANPAHKTEQKK